MYLSVRFLALVEQFHLDCVSAEVDQLAAQFVAEVSLILYLTQSLEVKVLTVDLAELRRSENVFRYLRSYGLGFRLYPLAQQGQFILASYLDVFTSESEVFDIRVLITSSERRAA